MPAKLRTLIHVLSFIVGAVAFLWLGLIWLPAEYFLLWFLFVMVAGLCVLQLLFRQPASRARVTPNTHRLTRSRDPWILGVCGGIAEFLGWQPGVVRGLWMLFSLLFAGVGGLLIYTILALVMPPPDRGGKFRLDDFRVQ